MLGCVVAALVAAGVAVAATAPGARSIEPGEVTVQRQAEIIKPHPKRAYGDKGQMYADGCQLGAGEVTPKWCVYGNPSSDTTVFLVGDSTGMHYFPGIHPVAVEHGWRLVGMTKAGCSLALYPRDAECERWQRTMFELLAEERPDMIITGGRAKVDSAPTPVVIDGWERAFRRLERTGAKVVLMASTPEPPFNVPRCVERNRDDLTACAMRRKEVMGYTHTDVLGAERAGGVTIVKTTPLLCNEWRCPAVIGNVLIYRTTAHFTATWMESMSDHLERMLPAP